MSEECHAMTRREREDLAQLTRQRERVAKTAAKQRSAELLADAEKSLATTFRKEDERWRTIVASAEEEVKAVNARILEHCREEGVPEQFAPSLNTYFLSRGENGLKERRVELRKVAQTRIAALEAKAKSEIERRSLEIQTQLLAAGLDTGAALAFLASMPTAEQLMPALAVGEIEAAVPLPSLRSRE